MSSLQTHIRLLGRKDPVGEKCGSEPHCAKPRGRLERERAWNHIEMDTCSAVLGCTASPLMRLAVP
jgi:hypothetical protein